ncbi:trans-sialidase [Trypanosoma cruzi]|nr:trans-sialidase [Trypanosoma cruzi]
MGGCGSASACGSLGDCLLGVRCGARVQHPVLSGESRRKRCFPRGIVVGAMQTASTSARTSRVVPGHSCGTTRCEGTCYRSADHRIYLGKHEGNNRSTSVSVAANLHGCPLY